MASLTAVRVKSATLSGATVDDVTITGGYPLVEVLNRGTNVLWVTSGSDPDDPTDAGDECEPVSAGERITVANVRDPLIDTVVKILGNGDAYSVIGTSR